MQSGQGATQIKTPAAPTDRDYINKSMSNSLLQLLDVAIVPQEDKAHTIAAEAEMWESIPVMDYPMTADELADYILAGNDSPVNLNHSESDEF